MAKNYYRSGSSNATCDVCGGKFKVSEMRTRWDGFFVCREDYEERQPQDFVRARQDKISVPIVRPIAPTPSKIPYGWQDIVHVKDDLFISVVLASRSFLDTVSVTEKFQAFRYFFGHDLVTVSDSFNIVNDGTLTFSGTEHVYPYENGIVCYLDYVDHTYFSEIYIGTCYDFPAAILTDTATTDDSGFIIPDPYVVSGYFASNYVGTTTYFNP